VKINEQVEAEEKKILKEITIEEKRHKELLKKIN